MKVKVNVTEQNIAAGKKKNCKKCPVALALVDAGFKAVSVRGYADITVAANVRARNSPSLDYFDRKLAAILSAPKKVDVFIERFDAGAPVKPFSFFLCIPKDVAKNVMVTAQAA